MTSQAHPILARERIRLACAASGCTFQEVQGPAGLAFNVDCPTDTHKLFLLESLGELDACDPWVKERAGAIAAQHHAAPVATCIALHKYVRDGVRFVEEPIETFAAARQTLTWQLGDCDCSSLALYALLRSIGYTCRFETLGTPATHVAVQVFLNGAWHWLETTVAAEPGEHPLDAVKRLNLSRPDIH